MGFATLESFRRDVDGERIAAIAREREPEAARSGPDRGGAGSPRVPGGRAVDRGTGPAEVRPAARPRLDPEREAGVARRARAARERAAAGADTVPRHGTAPAESIPLQRAARRATRARRGWVAALTSVIVVVALAACGAASWFLLNDAAGDTTGPAHTADPATSATTAGPDNLAARDTDREPLTSAELFGGTELTAGNGEYRVLKTEVLTDCAAATTDTMRPHLTSSDCTQVVRATVADAAGEHAATVGVVNLADTKAATKLRENIEDGSGGAFNALRARGPSAELGLNPTVLGFNTFGHYLLYAVIGRADGGSPSRDDSEVSAIVADLVDVYLVDRLEPRRE